MSNDGYKVRWFQDEEYEVVKAYDNPYEPYVIDYCQVFKGNIAECEAWLRLKRSGDLT